MLNRMSGLSDISCLRDAQSRSICAENMDGAKGGGARADITPGVGAARDLGKGWKVKPCIQVPAGKTLPLADIEGPGMITQIWMTCFPDSWRSLILRFTWDDEPTPSVEVPIGDFFAQGWCTRALVNSLAVCVNPAGGLNCYWPMPFRKKARITVENRSGKDHTLFYQINYSLEAVADDQAYFHAQFRRSNPLAYKSPHRILDGVEGRGHYVGTYIAWGVNNNNWWGEGEIKFYMDGDDEYPTICGTGTEDYFGGAWNFEMPAGQYGVFSTAYSGLPQVIQPDGLYKAQQRFGMYRWHLTDPVRFNSDLRVDIQALGWRSEGRYLALQDDIASTAFWYQADPHGAFPQLGSPDDLEVI